MRVYAFWRPDRAVTLVEVSEAARKDRQMLVGNSSTMS